MNPVEQLLYDEVTHFIDRLATSVEPGPTLQMTIAALRGPLDEAETELAAARAAIVESYGRWRRALEEVDNLWALAAWRSTVAEEPRDQTAALAA